MRKSLLKFVELSSSDQQLKARIAEAEKKIANARFHEELMDAIQELGKIIQDSGVTLKG